MNDKQDAVPAGFEEIVARLEPLLEELKGGPGYHGLTLRNLPKKGVYVFYEDGRPMYVGRVGSNSKQTVRQRIRQHTIQAQGIIRQPSRSGYSRKTLAFQWAMSPT